MNRDQLNHQARLEVVAAFLGLRASELAVNPLIASNTVLLNAILTTIRDLKQVQDRTTKGATRTLTEIEKDVRGGIFKVGAAIAAYATEAKNYDLLALATFADTDITHMRKSDLADKARTIYEAAEPVAPELLIHQVTSEDIAFLRADQTAYLNALNGKRGVQTQTKQATAAIKLKLKEGDALLKEKIAVHLRPFKLTNPTVYGEFKNACIIVDIAATHDTKGDITVKAIDDVTGEPIANAEAMAKKKNGTDMIKSVKRSEADGMAPFPPLEPGEYDYEVVVDGYVTATGTFVVEIGKMKEVVVRMRRSA